jgi:hypothetical protein
MRVFTLQRHGFRAIACANETHYCWVEFYPHSPHFTWDKEAIAELDNWLKDWEKTNQEIPNLSEFCNWKQDVEKRVEELSWMEESEIEEIKIPEHWELLSQTFFLAGLSINETVGTLND